MFNLSDVPNKASFFVNKQKVDLKNSISNNINYGVIPVPFDIIENCLKSDEDISIFSVVNNQKSHPIIIKKESILNFNNKHKKELIPALFRNLLHPSEMTHDDCRKKRI